MRYKISSPPPQKKHTHTISEICVNCKTYTKRKIVTTKVTFFYNCVIISQVREKKEEIREAFFLNQHPSLLSFRKIKHEPC